MQRGMCLINPKFPLDPFTADYPEIVEEVTKNRSPFPKDRLSGIYFLFIGNEITYIGSSMDLMSRISLHKTNHPEYTHYYIIPLSMETIEERWLESEFIMAFQPRNNKSLNINSYGKTGFKNIQYIPPKNIAKQFGISLVSIKEKIRNLDLPTYTFSGKIYVHIRNVQELVIRKELTAKNKEDLLSYGK